MEMNITIINGKPSKHNKSEPKKNSTKDKKKPKNGTKMNITIINGKP